MKETTDDTTTLERVGNYLNIYTDGSLRVSLSEDHNEVLVYKDGQDEPEGHFSFEDGSLKRNR